MSVCSTIRRCLIASAAVLALLGSTRHTSATQLLVADRLTNSIFRYNDDGSFLGLVLTDNTFLNQPTGIAISPDQSKLYVSSFQNSRVMQYDYNAIAGTASNPLIFAEGAADSLDAPNAIAFSPDGSKIYVSNLGTTGVAQFKPDGSSAGAAINGSIGGGSIFQFSGLAFGPTGELLVGGFQDFPGGTSGAIAKSNAARTSISDYIGPSTSLNGTSSLLVRGNDLYVSAMFSGNIQRFNLTTGLVDPSFGISGLAFPQALVAAPSGNSFLAGILGFSNGSGGISRYDYNGNLLGSFASPTSGQFTEATALVTIASPFAGDTNGDHVVNFSDLSTLLLNYNQPGTFAKGDFNYSGRVDFSDLSLLLLHYNQTAPLAASLAAAVPEPSTLLLCCCGIFGLLLAARKRVGR